MSGDAIAAFGDDPALRWQRRAMLIASERATGIDRVDIAEVRAGALRLHVHFVPSAHRDKPAVPPHIRPDNVLVTRLAGSGPVFAASAVHYPPRGGGTLAVEVPAGIAALGGAETGLARLEIRGVAAIDPLFAGASFALTEGARGATDPGASAPPAAVLPTPPAIDYIAKDFNSFRRLMLDHVTALMPQWHERHVADVGNVVIDLLAYAADNLSYYQDAVATEAYLATARRRNSVRRHARLLDYRLHEGCASRVWLHVEVDRPCTVAAGLRAICAEPGRSPQGAFSVAGQALPPRDGRAVFESLEDAALQPSHYRMPLYAWGLPAYRLQPGANHAALDGAFPDLAAGDVLILEGAAGSASGAATPQRRHPVRLMRPPRSGRDPTNQNHAITEIVWHAADALPFEILVGPHGGHALGNIVAADAGFTIGRIAGDTELLSLQIDARGAAGAVLRHPDLIHAVPYDPETERSRPAAEFTRIDPSNAVPAIRLEGDSGALADDVWVARSDLLACDPFACAFVVECESDARASLRFGDGVHGLRPPPDAGLRAIYRTGAGARNVAAGAVHAWDPRPGDEAITGVNNQLPAAGGVGPAPLAQARRAAPMASRGAGHCVVAEDYAAAARQDPRVCNAVAVRRWIGDRHAVFVHVQPAHGVHLDANLRAALTADLAARRVLGGDVVVVPPNYVPLQITLTVSVAPSRAPAAARRDVIGRVQALFAGNRLRFGEPVYLSPVVAAAMDVAGIVNVAVEAFARYGKGAPSAITAEQIDLAPTEIARLDNRPDAPWRGTLTVTPLALRETP
jgi:hypothetical protein